MFWHRKISWISLSPVIWQHIWGFVDLRKVESDHSASNLKALEKGVLRGWVWEEVENSSSSSPEALHLPATYPLEPLERSRNTWCIWFWGTCQTWWKALPFPHWDIAAYGLSSSCTHIVGLNISKVLLREWEEEEGLSKRILRPVFLR